MERGAEFESAWRRAVRHGWKIADCQAHRYVMVLRKGKRSYFIGIYADGRVSRT
jgi:hypothetical protein